LWIVAEALSTGRFHKPLRIDGATQHNNAPRSATQREAGQPRRTARKNVNTARAFDCARVLH